MFNVGHSGTSISAAAGFAQAKCLKGEKDKIIAVIGDGSMTTGLAFEALNWAGDSKKDMIIVGGLNVYPREVEECLYENPKVAEAAVIGVADDLRGEVPKAFIVLKPGAQATPREFRMFARARLANYKCPRQVAIVDSLPKTATGKIDKKQLKEANAMGILQEK